MSLGPRHFFRRGAVCAALVASAFACGSSADDEQRTPPGPVGVEAPRDAAVIPDHCDWPLPDGAIWFSCTTGERCVHPDGCNSCQCVAGSTSPRCKLLACADGS